MAGKPKGLKKTGGRTKGKENKFTKQAKELVVDLVDYGLEKAKRKLDEIEDPKDYLDTLSKFIGYVMPKKTSTDLTTDGQPIIWNEVKTYEPNDKAD